MCNYVNLNEFFGTFVKAMNDASLNCQSSFNASSPLSQSFHIFTKQLQKQIVVANCFYLDIVIDIVINIAIVDCIAWLQKGRKRHPKSATVIAAVAADTLVILTVHFN